jgi:hypothetical protein
MGSGGIALIDRTPGRLDQIHRVQPCRDRPFLLFRHQGQDAEKSVLPRHPSAENEGNPAKDIIIT